VPHLQLSITTEAVRQIVDITDEAREAVRASGVRDGLALVAVPHCTCAVYVNENEDGLVADTLAFLSDLAASGKWQHDRIDDNAAAHLVAAVMGSGVCLPVAGCGIELGTWQRIMLVELDGPRQRCLTVTVIRG
jgi:secondary thiamine-phosphate synthase enzyme